LRKAARSISSSKNRKDNKCLNQASFSLAPSLCGFYFGGNLLD
jgi:hypothetical protein